MASKAHRKIRPDEFLGMNFGSDRRFELIDGVIYAMGGGSAAHARVQNNIAGFLHQALKGSGCRAYGPDLAIETLAHTVRYPDVSIYCGDPGLHEQRGDARVADPRVIIEVLSPSTRDEDEGRKLEEYQSLSSVQTVALVDPDDEDVRVFQRGSDGRWDVIPSKQTNDIALPSLGITIPTEEIFARG